MRSRSVRLGLILIVLLAVAWPAASFVAHARHAAVQHERNANLLSAAVAGNLPEVRSLLARGASVDYRDNVTPLEAACENDHADVAKALLDAGAKVDGSPGYVAPLQLAAESRSTACTRLLLKRGASVNARGWGGRTALYWAADSNAVGCALLLLEHGARADIRDDDFTTPEEAAKARGSKGVLALLKRAKPSSESETRGAPHPAKSR